MPEPLVALATCASIGHSERRHSPQPEGPMAWKKPRIVEVSLALEINAYACAEIG
jgi:coenzyme PQQ precursor peptide PqqA